LCFAIQTLLELHWEKAGLTPRRTFDGIESRTIHHRKKERLVVHGLVLWGDRIGAEDHLEVFGLEVKVDPDRLCGYTLMFGRKGAESRRLSHRDHVQLIKEIDEPNLWEWAHVFEMDRASP
jgi:hypothetical protein